MSCGHFEGIANFVQWFARYGFWAILGLLGPILAQKIGFAHLSVGSPSQSVKSTL